MYFPFTKFFGKTFVIFFSFFLYVLSYQEERLLKKHKYEHAKNKARRGKIDQKIDTFSHFDNRVLAIFGSKKSISGVCQKCFGIVYEVFWHYFRP